MLLAGPYLLGVGIDPCRCRWSVTSDQQVENGMTTRIENDPSLNNNNGHSRSISRCPMSKMNTPRQPQTSVDTSSRIEMIQDTSPSYSRATPMFYSKDRFLGVANNLRPWDYVVNKSNVRKGETSIGEGLEARNLLVSGSPCSIRHKNNVCNRHK